MLDLQDAISLLERGDAQEAARLLEEMSDRMPGYATARVLLARAYEGMDAWDHALRSWRQALHIIPNSPVVQRGLVRAAQKAAATSPLPRVSTSGKEADSWGDSGAAELETGPIESRHGRREGEEGPAVSQSFGAADIHTWPKSRIQPDLTEPEPHVEPDRTAPEPHVDPDVTAPQSRAEPDRTEPDSYADPERYPAEPAPEGPSPTAPPGTEERAEEEETAGGYQEDLDRLISELESARIVPRPDLDDVPTPDLEDDIEDVVSETLAKIYASQGQFGEAARVYEILAAQDPGRRDEFGERASEMRARASE